MSKAQKSETACPHKCAQDGMCLEKKSQAYNCAETRHRNDRQAMVCVYHVCTRPFTQCARLQCMYTPTVGAHLGSLCMRALPHVGLGILAIPCDTVRGYMCGSSRNPAKPCDTSAISARNHRETARYHRETTEKPYVLHMVYWLPYRHSEDKSGICEARAQS